MVRNMHACVLIMCLCTLKAIGEGLAASRYFTERLVRACAELPKLCEFFHIPFQSGDNDILREMRCAPRHGLIRTVVPLHWASIPAILAGHSSWWQCWAVVRVHGAFAFFRGT